MLMMGVEDQAIVGAVVGGGWTVIAFQVTQKAYNHLQQHPPAHNLPLGLTADVNQLLLTMVSNPQPFLHNFIAE